MVSFKSLVFLALGSLSAAATTTTSDNWSTYPSVAHTASINGFADKIYDDLPPCAQGCVKQDTGSIPCPYWDTGCLCVWQPWNGPVADCVASSCTGTQVQTVTSLATSLCSSAGVASPYWLIPASASTALSSAAST